MKKITKHDMPGIARRAMVESGIDPSVLPGLALAITMSNAIDLDRDEPLSSSSGRWGLVVVGRESKQAVRTSGRHVNVFALASIILSVTTAKIDLPACVSLVVALLGSCTISISPQQSAFFLAVKDLERSGADLTAQAIAERMGTLLCDSAYATGSALDVISELKALGVGIKVGPAPDQLIECNEAQVILPGF